MSTNPHDHAKEQQSNSIYAALARTTTRAVALYFSRPVRLFRPPKVSGWHSLRGHANMHGTTLSIKYLSALVKKQGFMVIPKHFVPPMVINAMLGTVLWTTYTKSSNFLEAPLGAHPTLIAALSGAVAGGMQALVAAPVENARLIVEGGTGRGWSHAWKEVFQATEHRSTSKADNIREIRQVRHWMKEVSEMAGRGWDGWGWGCAKDVCGFAAFFMIFEITRRVALASKAAAQDTIHRLSVTPEEEQVFGRHVPRIIHGITLVTGGASAGLAYEIIGRPWDVSRRTIRLERTLDSNIKHPLFAIVQKIREDGIIHFFRDPPIVGSEPREISTARRRIYSSLRTVSRVGPWGVGFLVWDAFGPSLS